MLQNCMKFSAAVGIYEMFLQLLELLVYVNDIAPQIVCSGVPVSCTHTVGVI